MMKKTKNKSRQRYIYGKKTKKYYAKRRKKEKGDDERMLNLQELF